MLWYRKSPPWTHLPGQGVASVREEEIVRRVSLEGLELLEKRWLRVKIKSRDSRVEGKTVNNRWKFVLPLTRKKLLSLFKLLDQFKARLWQFNLWKCSPSYLITFHPFRPLEVILLLHFIFQLLLDGLYRPTSGWPIIITFEAASSASVIFHLNTVS